MERASESASAPTKASKAAAAQIVDSRQLRRPTTAQLAESEQRRSKEGSLGDGIKPALICARDADAASREFTDQAKGINNRLQKALKLQTEACKPGDTTYDGDGQSDGDRKEAVDDHWILRNLARYRERRSGGSGKRSYRSGRHQKKIAQMKKVERGKEGIRNKVSGFRNSFGLIIGTSNGPPCAKDATFGRQKRKPIGRCYPGGTAQRARHADRSREIQSPDLAAAFVSLGEAHRLLANTIGRRSENA